VSLLADALVAVGFFIVFLVFRENTYTSATVELAQDQQVVTTGPYGVVRHPMYSGAMLLLIATPIALGSWVAFPMWLPLLLVIVARLREEEKFLSESLEGYRDYTGSVRYRLLPGVW
jgi:protein-S-isoprenylcysteine O-methyltransferase Ste14